MTQYLSLLPAITTECYQASATKSHHKSFLTMLFSENAVTVVISYAADMAQESKVMDSLTRRVHLYVCLSQTVHCLSNCRTCHQWSNARQQLRDSSSLPTDLDEILNGCHHHDGHQIYVGQQKLVTLTNSYSRLGHMKTFISPTEETQVTLVMILMIIIQDNS